MAGPRDQPEEKLAPQVAASPSARNKSPQQMLPTAGPLIFTVNGKKVVLAPGTWNISQSLNEYLRAQLLMRGTVSISCDLL